jgi:hypothetical protein
MAHNAEAGGRGGGLRSLQLSYDEANVLYWQRILVPLQFKCRMGGTSTTLATPCHRHLDRRCVPSSPSGGRT